VAHGWRNLPLSDADRAMLGYVELLALRPSAAHEEHVVELRRAGFTDEQIFEIVMVTAYYALRCRMADGLGVELDARAQRDAALVKAFAYRDAAGGS
jgi:alkylhydroperoxidase family enzyme